MSKTPSTKSAPAKKAAPAKKSAPAKATPAKKAAAPAKALAVVPDPAPESTEDALLLSLREKAQALQAQHPKITMAEIAKELGVSAAVAREIVEGTPKAAPAKTTRTASTGGQRVSGRTVTVESNDSPITCRVCNTEKPARQFPTISGPTQRGTECRACRDTRRDAAIDARLAEVAPSK